MSMFSLYTSLFAGRSREQEEFFRTVAFLKGIDTESLTSEARESFETETLDEVKAYAATQVEQLAAETGEETLIHWNMALKSGFKEKLVDQYPEVETTMDIIIKRYFTQLINQKLDTLTSNA